MKRHSGTALWARAGRLGVLPAVGDAPTGKAAHRDGGLHVGHSHSPFRGKERRQSSATAVTFMGHSGRGGGWAPASAARAHGLVRKRSGKKKMSLPLLAV